MFHSIQKRPIGFVERAKLYSVAKGELNLVQRLKLDRKLEVHNGCVNTICWNDHGQFILSGSDDQTLVVSDPFTTKKIFSIRSGHRANIFSAKFLPNSQDKQIVSCSGDGKVFFTEVEREDNYGINLFDCHFGTTYEVITVPNEVSTFLSCGEDGTVRWFDLRMKTSCHKENCKEDVLINCRRAVTSLAVNPMLPYELAIACSDSTVRIYDRRMLGTRATGNYVGKSNSGQICRFTAPTLADRSYRITSLGYSPDGTDVLVSYSSEHIYLFGTKNMDKIQPLKKIEEPFVSKQVESEESTSDHTAGAHSKQKTLPVVIISEAATEMPTAEVVETAEIAETAETVETVETAEAPDAAEAAETTEEDTSVDINADPSHQPPIKRLRLRGDWSDTGPNARPESERQQDEGDEGRRSPHTTIMQRMSDMLTRWLDGNLNRDPEDQSNRNEGEPQPGGSSGADNQTEQPSSGGTSGADNQTECPSSAESSKTDNQTEHLSSTGSSGANNQIEHSPLAGSSKADNQTELQYSADMERTSGASNWESDQNIIEGKDRLSGVTTQMKNTNTSVTKTADGVSGADNQVQNPKFGVTESTDTSIRFEDRLGLVHDKHEEHISDISASHTSHQFNDSVSESERQHVSVNIDNEECDSTVETLTAVMHGTDNIPLQESNKENVIRLDDSDDSTSNLVSDSTITVSDVANNAHSLSNSPDRSDSSFPSNSSSPAQPVPLQGRLEPVISLHYSTQGTTSSTVHLGFAAFENLEAGVLQRSAEDASLNPLVSGAAQETSSHASKSCERSRKVASSSKLDSRVSAKDKQDNRKDCRDSGNSGDVCGEKSVDRGESRATLMGSDDSMKMNFAAEKVVSVCDITAQPAPAENDSSTTDEVLHSGSDNPCIAPKTVCSGNYSSEGASASGGRSLESKSKQSTGASAVSGGRAITRQRRIGRSGPPTGEYQLTLEDPDSSDDDIAPPVRTRREERSIDRSTAAIRLQRIYRKRQEEKEREREERETKSIHQPDIKIKFKGHRNTRTMIKESSFWGNHFVMSGSDCGHIFIWDRNTAQLVMLLEGDRHVVNCLQPHPYDPVLASSGIDYNIKLWAPLEEQPNFDEERATEIMRRNEIMLDETRDTITVPAAFMLRVLASLNQIRSGRSSQSQENQEDQESSSDTD